MEPPVWQDQETGASLPGAEEIRTQLALNEASSPKRNTKRIGLVAALLVGCIVAFIFAFGGGSRSTPDISGAERMSEAQEFLSFISDKDALNTPGTPEYQAAEWLAIKDPRKLSPPASTTYKNSYWYFQRYILALMYFKLGGEDWDVPRALKFMSKESECKWNVGLDSDFAVPGSDATSWVMGVLCNDNDEVDYLFLPGIGLKGELPSEIGMLLALKHLSLFANELEGSLPDTFGYLSDLDFLAIESNQLTGEIPKWFEDLAKLEYIALGDNQFQGTLPNLKKMSNLKEVALDNNQLTGSINEKFNGLKNLQAVFLQDNELTGEINDNFLKGSPIVELDLSDNGITGTFPQHFYDYTIVDLHNNSITGEFPSVTSGTHPLKYLSVYRNGMTGGIPNLIGALTALTHLDVSVNEFTGSIPDSINMLSDLRYLFMANNNFEAGAFPPLWRMENLVELSLKNTNRINKLPNWIDTLENLVLLDLDDNQFTGEIPSAFGKLSELRFLLLNRNLLSGRVPDSFVELKNLVLFMVDQNDLSFGLNNVCRNGSDKLEVITSDCDKAAPEINCDCCTLCCSDDNPSCNNAGLIPNLDDTYVRDQYVFSEDLIFTVEQFL